MFESNLIPDIRQYKIAAEPHHFYATPASTRIDAALTLASIPSTLYQHFLIA
jgi:hypothetical protein